MARPNIFQIPVAVNMVAGPSGKKYYVLLHAPPSLSRRVLRRSPHDASTNSKNECHREFQLTWALSDCHPGDDPGASAINAIVSWISRTNVVEEIKGIEAELGCEVFPYRRVLGNGQVGIEERWTIVGVPSIVPKLIEERPGKRSRNRSILEHWANWFEVGPAVVRGVERSEMHRQNAARLVGLAGAVRNVRSALAIVQTNGETARPAQIRAQLPPADQEIRHLRNAAEKLLIATERQSVVSIELELLCPQIIESSVNDLACRSGRNRCFRS